MYYSATIRLYYFNARWNDPKLGRFITENPARDGINWFIYCLNNPLPAGFSQRRDGTVWSPETRISTPAEAEVPSYELLRPYIRNGTIEAVAANAPRTSDGRFIDINTRQPIDGKYDLGHRRGNEFWREKARAQSEGLTQAEFNDRMNDLSLYQIEDPVSNRSHKYELPKEN